MLEQPVSQEDEEEKDDYRYGRFGCQRGTEVEVACLFPVHPGTVLEPVCLVADGWEGQKGEEGIETLEGMRASDSLTEIRLTVYCYFNAGRHSLFMFTITQLLNFTSSNCKVP